MGRSSWLIIIAVGTLLGVLVFVVLILGIFGERRPLGGPVAVVVGGDAPEHGFLGITLVKSTSLLTIQGVLKGSGADIAGLQPGDVILAIGPEDQPDLATFQRLGRASVPGGEMSLRIARGFDEMSFRVKLISFTDTLLLRERERNQNSSLPEEE